MATLIKTDGSKLEIQPQNGLDFQLDELQKFVDSFTMCAKETFLIPNDRHCSYCIHYEPCPDFRMYCKALQRRITARKKPCKFYEIKQTHGTRTSR